MRGRLDGAKMEFNRLVNEIKELRKVNRSGWMAPALTQGAVYCLVGCPLFRASLLSPT